MSLCVTEAESESTSQSSAQAFDAQYEEKADYSKRAGQILKEEKVIIIHHGKPHSIVAQTSFGESTILTVPDLYSGSK